MLGLALGLLSSLSAAVAGVLLVAREPAPEWRSAGRAAIGLASFAALGFGLFFLGIDTATEDGGTAWAIVAARVGGVTVLLAAALVARPQLRRAVPLLPVLVAIGTLDVIANASFAAATQGGAALPGRRRRLALLGGDGAARPPRPRRAAGALAAGGRRARGRGRRPDRLRRLGLLGAAVDPEQLP